MIRYFEESQSRVVMEQNKKLEECTNGKKDLTAAITILMAEVKMINAKTNTPTMKKAHKITQLVTEKGPR